MPYTKIFHTVPIVGDIMTRDGNGNKVDGNGKPITFKGKWSKYIEDKNTNNTPLLGAIALKDFIGIDVDTTKQFNAILRLLKAIDVVPTYIAKSMPDSLNKGGHILFSYQASISETLEPIVKYLKKVNIDIQIGSKLIYLATPSNKTKLLMTPTLTKIEDLIELPNELCIYLQGLATPFILEDSNKVSYSDTSTSNKSMALSVYSTDYFGYILDTDSLLPDIVYRLTPKRDYPMVISMDDIPQGQFTDWFLQVRKKLQADVSVSPSVFSDTMLYLNSLRSAPNSTDRIQYDTKRDLESVDFVYDEEWKTKNLILITDNKHTIEVLYSPSTNIYVLFNRTMQTSDLYLTFSSCSDAITALTHKIIPKPILLKKAMTTTIINTPISNPFITQDETIGLPTFNLFRPTEELQILRGDINVPKYIEPTSILTFFDNLIPDKDTRNRFLKYVAYKYSTYDYSPLYFVMAGVGGAGKGTLVHDILTRISSHSRVMSVEFKNLTNNFNSFLGTVDWLELEEATEGLNIKEMEKLVGILKRITGNPYISIEKKGKDIVTERHFVTPIISTNLQTKLITDTVENDRRLVLLRCPNKLTSILPFKAVDNRLLTNTEEFIKQLHREIPSFCYWLNQLHTSTPLPSSQYHSNTDWKSDDYKAYIEDTLTPHDKLYQYASTRDLKGFVDILVDANVHKDDIDSLFKLSVDGSNAMLVLYSTGATSSLDITTLEELYNGSTSLVGNPRKDFISFKEKKSKRIDFVVHSFQVLLFNDSYTRFSEVSTLSEEDIIDSILAKQ